MEIIFYNKRHSQSLVFKLISTFVMIHIIIIIIVSVVYVAVVVIVVVFVVVVVVIAALLSTLESLSSSNIRQSTLESHRGKGLRRPQEPRKAKDQPFV